MSLSDSSARTPRIHFDYRWLPLVAELPGARASQTGGPGRQDPFVPRFVSCGAQPKPKRSGHTPAGLVVSVAVEGEWAEGLGGHWTAGGARALLRADGTAGDQLRAEQASRRGGHR